MSSQAWCSAHTDRGVIQQPYHQIAGMGETRPTDGRHPVIKPKDLIGIPWMLAFALRAGGWWLRSDIVWQKPNCQPESVEDRPTRSHEYVFLLTKARRYYYDAEAIKTPCKTNTIERAKANARDVWSIPTEANHYAHFATMPQSLAEMCIRAGTSERGCCPRCGVPWERIVERERCTDGRAEVGPRYGEGYALARLDDRGNAPSGLLVMSTTTGWQPGCSCGEEPVPCTVLDSFAGSGTTLAVAKALGRSAIGIELNGEYVAMAQERVATMQGRLGI